MNDDTIPIPPSVLWLDAAGVGRMIGFTVRHVREELVNAEGFPKPSRVGGRPRWNAAEVHAWMLAQREHTDGRKRAA